MLRQCRKCKKDGEYFYARKEVDGIPGVVPTFRCDCGALWEGDWRSKKEQRQFRKQARCLVCKKPFIQEQIDNEHSFKGGCEHIPQDIRISIG